MSGRRPYLEDADSYGLEETGEKAIPLRPRRGAESSPHVESSYAVVPGALLEGKYRIIRTIGHGGMGVVLAARHEQLDVPVAMKLLSPELVGSPDAVSRFLREARAVSKLQSAHVARVLDVGSLVSGEPYIVMEYLAGEDLQHHAKVQRPTVGEAIDYIVQACDAIAEAHSAGIVHRDIKPANLFLTRRHGGAPLVKVLDFGVSKLVDYRGGPAEVHLTSTTTIVGSALYMSPEQMRSSKHVDQRTDIYALGVCLYELIGGQPPHVADSFAQLCAKVFTEKPLPLSAIKMGLPEGLDRVIDRALRQDPNERYSSVAELVHALSPYAFEATRARARALLAEYAPGLEMAPPFAYRADPSFSSNDGAISASRQMTNTGRRSMEVTVDAPRSQRKGFPGWMLFAVAALVGGLAAAVLANGPLLRLVSAIRTGIAAANAQATASAPTPAQAPSVAAVPAATAEPARATAAPAPSAAPSEAPSASASASASASPSASASASAAADASEAPSASAAPSADPRAARGNQRASEAPASRAPVRSAPTRRGSSQVTSDLTTITCKQYLPDGTVRVVPCP